MQTAYLMLSILLSGLWSQSVIAAPKCVIFVHGHRSTSDIAYQYAQAESYWMGFPTRFFGGEEESHYGDGVAAATLSGYHHSYLVNYDPTRPYPQASVDVANQIERAIEGLPDQGGLRFCPPVSEGEPTQYVVVAHSMGGVVMDFILGNATPTTPNYNFQGAPFARVAQKLSYAVAIGSPHVGTRSAEVIMGSTRNVGYEVLRMLFSEDGDPGTEWLQTSPNFQVSRQMSSPYKEIRLYAGKEKMISSIALFGDDDGVASVTSAFACEGNPNANRRVQVRGSGFPYYDLPVCENTPAGHMGGFQNLSNRNWSRENHGDQRRSLIHHSRESDGVPGGSSCLNEGSLLEEVSCNLGK